MFKYSSLTIFLKGCDNLFNIIQIGAGGTGCHLVHFLSQYATNQNKINKYIIIDGDIVEEKNLFRQNFLPQHVGSYKAEVVGKTYGIDYFCEYVNEKNIEHFFNKDLINIVIGCIDTVKCRLMIDTFIKQNIMKYKAVYFDGGNLDSTAQVIVYDYINSIGQDVSEFFKDKEYLDQTVSCSELGDQTILANMMAATYLMTNVCFYIENEEIKYTHYIINKHFIQVN